MLNSRNATPRREDSSNKNSMARYFTLKELISTSRKIDNTPTFEAVRHLEELVEKLLDPLRYAYNKPIRVTSGYRCPALNKAVGGATTSAHLNGFAADLQDWNGDTEALITFARNWVILNRVSFDQLIRETSSDGNTVWLHFGLYGPGGCQRGQILNLVKK